MASNYLVMANSAQGSVPLRIFKFYVDAKRYAENAWDFDASDATEETYRDAYEACRDIRASVVTCIKGIDILRFDDGIVSSCCWSTGMHLRTSKESTAVPTTASEE
ncbi:hypothetical protein VN12_19680 [Pirellula sp. SH-Sr6A]|nr:hypothetical protein VN12_19680 [Pirellula sp. SH-Sr6A]